MREPEKEPSANSKPCRLQEHVCVLKNMSQTDSFRKVSLLSVRQPSHLFSDFSSPESLFLSLAPLGTPSAYPHPSPITSLFTAFPVSVTLPGTHSSSIQPGILCTNYGRAAEQGGAWNKARPITLYINRLWVHCFQELFNNTHKTQSSEMHLVGLLGNKLKYLECLQPGLWVTRTWERREL